MEAQSFQESMLPVSWIQRCGHAARSCWIGRDLTVGLTARVRAAAEPFLLPAAAMNKARRQKDTHRCKRDTTRQQDHVVVVVRVEYSTVTVIAKTLVERREIQWAAVPNPMHKAH